MRRFVEISRAALSLIIVLLVPLASTALELKDDGVFTEIALTGESSEETSFEFSLIDFESTETLFDGVFYTDLNIGDETRAAPESWPDLPSVVRLALIPAQSGVELKIENLTTHVVPNFHPFAQILTLEGEEEPALDGRLSLSPECLNSNDFWPPEPALLGEPVVLRGHRLIPVAINPFRWNPRTGELLVIDEISITLDYSSAQNNVNLVREPDHPRPSLVVDRIIQDLVINPPVPERDNGVRNGSIVYVMGNWDNVEEALEPLIEWRRRMGWTVAVLRVAENNSAAAIRTDLMEAYEEWDVPPEYVVICGDTDGNFPMAFWNMQRGANYPYESDHLYGCLDGDDLIPDAAVGRLIFGDINMLDAIVEKIVNYESAPFLGDNDRQRNWQKRAALVAGDSRSGNSSIDLCLWTKNLLTRNGYARVNELYWTAQNQQPNANQFIRENFSDGISLYLYRGWTGMNGFAHAEVDELRNGRMLPFVMLATCNTGDYGEHGGSQYYYTERFLYSARGGAIGAVGSAGATHTAYNNLISSEAFRAIYAGGVPWQGWALGWSKIGLWANYGPYDDIAHEENNGLDGWECETYIFNLMGDPAVELFTDVPRLLDIEHPVSIRQGESHFEVTVNYDDTGNPAPGVRVCLYKADVFQFLKLTDDGGNVEFDLDPSDTEAGEIKLTVTSHNLMPYLRQFQIAQAAQFLGVVDFDIDDDDEGESLGNGNHIVNPGERIELSLDIANLGAQVPGGGFDVSLTSETPHLTVLEGQARLNQAPAVGRSMPVGFLVEVEGGFPAEKDAILQVEVAGQQSWRSSVQIPVRGAVLIVDELSWTGEPLEPGGVGRFRLYVKNIGEIACSELSSSLISLTPTVNVPVPQAAFISIPAGSRRLSQTSYQVAANIFHVGGSKADFALRLENEGGLVDTAFFSIIVSEAGPGQPFGPDRYGYYCLDDEDETWINVPEYNWIEIDPHRRGPGANTNLSDTAEEDDHSRVVDLPFEFTYYGQTFERITICTNGWLAMGDCHELNTARNRKIPDGMAPGMICPFWEDLLTTANGGIYTWFDENNDRFVIEWSQMRKLGPRVGEEPLETFEVVLFDPQSYPTLTGDGNILFQYSDVTDDRYCYQTWDTPFASVGIGSPDQSDGLSYTYWGELSAGASALEDGRAILFTTNMLSTTGVIRGSVTDAATGQPLANAAVITQHGFLALTDENGEYQMENAPAEVEFSITASRAGYNDSTRAGFALEQNGELEINFNLLHPEFVVSVDVIEERVLIEQQSEYEFQVENQGNGPLRWSVEKQNPDGAEFDPWDLRVSFPASEILEDTHVYGAVFTNDRFYVAGGGDNQPMIYVMNRDFELIDSFNQFGDSHYGITDLTWDGELLWGSGEDLVFGFTLEGELIVTLDPPTSPIIGLAWDTEREILWMCGTTSEIFGVTREGQQVDRISRRNLRIYGLAYYPEDEIDHDLYIFNRPGLTEMFVHRMRIADADTERVQVLEPEAGGKPKGLFITPAYDYYSWVMIAGVDNLTEDRLDIWQLDTRRDWMMIDPVQGVVNPGEEQDFMLALDPRGMPEAELHGELIFTHNAAEGQTIIPVTMNVVGEIQREQRVSFLQGWNMISLNVTPSPEMYSDQENPGPDVVLMTDQLRIDENHHHILVMKDAAGRFYAPLYGFCGIPYWDLTQGYQVSVDTDLSTVWSGIPIPADQDLPLAQGWNLIAYYPDYSLSAEAPDFYVLSPILDQVNIAKDFSGAFLMPEFNFSNMSAWNPGQGYQVNVAEAVTLNYPAPEEAERLAISGDEDAPVQRIRPTGENMSLLINEFVGAKLTDGESILAISPSGLVIGSGVVNGNRCGLAIWGDDKTTEAVDGLRTGEAFRLALYPSMGSAPLDLEPLQFLTGEGSVYQPDGFIVLTASVCGLIPAEYYLCQGYPNPFNGSIHFEFGLPQDQMVKLQAFDLQGRMVDEISRGFQQAGRHTAVWEAGELPSGLYFVRFEAGGFRTDHKVTLLK